MHLDTHNYLKGNSLTISSIRLFIGKVIALLSVIVLLTGCGEQQWGWYVISPFTETGLQNIKFLVSGLVDTVRLSLTAISISIVIGLCVALPGISSRRGLKAINRGYVEIFRAIPLLVLLLWVYYGVPVVFDISISVFWAGVIALALSDSAFEAEIFRGGIQSIDKGQHEAAEALGLSYWRKMQLIILPQAIRHILPPLGNQLVYMLKMSSLVSVIGMAELTRRANELVVSEYRPLEIYSFLVLEYLVLILVVSAGVRKLERRLTIDKKG